MKEIYQYIIERIIQKDMDRDVGIELLNKLKNESEEKGYSDKIAVIGMAAHYPEADDLNEFWEVLDGGRDCMGKFPEMRQKDIAEYVKEKHKIRGDVVYQNGGYLPRIDLFDNKFFKIPYKEAERMDPNQRIFLQTSYEALEDAGYGGERLKGTRTGVFLGYSNSLREHYSTYVVQADKERSTISIQGNLESIIPSRLSYFLDLKGPSITFDTACSSSLTAIQAAMDSLKKRESNMAIAAGMKINFYNLLDGIKLGIESPREETSTFDNSADGVGVGEGIGVVVLKRYEDAVRDKDHIYATILGGASNQDGYSAGITVPNVDSQTDVLLSAWENSRISPDTLGYIEAHGTGTKIGDPIEVEAVTNAFNKFTSKKQFCAIGSVKSNLGHLFEGAGMASFIKAVLCLKKKQIPASIHFKVPNERIDWMNTPVYVNDVLLDWDQIKSNTGELIPRRCGVSAFGLSGTNCHIVLEEYNPKDSHISSVEKQRMFVLSSYDYEGLHQLVRKYCKYVKENKNIYLDALCRVLYTGRGHYNHRLAFCFENQQELLEKLTLFEKYGDKVDGTNGICYRQIILSVEYSKKGIKVCVSNKKIEEFNELAQKLIAVGDKLEEVCNLYAMGASIDWGKLVEKSVGGIPNLPIYAYKGSRCWMKYKPEPVSSVQYIDRDNKVFLERPTISSLEEDRYECNLSAQKDFVLRDHIIMGKPTLPGTAYLEMACEIAKNYMENGEIQMTGFKFMEPIMLNKDEVRTVHLSVMKNKEEYKVVFYSKKNEVDSTHAEVTIVSKKHDKKEKLDIKNLCSQSKEIITISQNDLTKGFIRFGKHWMNYHKIYLGENEGVAYLKMPDDIAQEKYEYTLHPSLVDMGVNAMSLMLGEPYLPLYYKKVSVYHSLPNEIYSYVRMKDKKVENSETMTYDVTFTDMEGNILVEFEGYIVKKVKDVDQLGKQISLSEFEWIPLAGQGTQEITGALIFDNGYSWSYDLWNFLIQNQKKAILVHECEKTQFNESECWIPYDKNGYESLLNTVAAGNVTYSHIIHFANPDNETSENLVEELEQNVHKVLEFVKVLCRNNMKVKFAVVTKHAYRVSKSDDRLSKVSAMLAGLCRTLSAEKHGIKTQCIDFDNYYTPVDLIRELEFETAVDNVAYRNSVRYELQIDFINNGKIVEQKVSLHRDGVYLITGGCGGIGLKTAEMLSKHEKVKIVLVNRKQFSERSLWKIILTEEENSERAEVIRTVQKIEEMGSQVYFRSADISEEKQVEALLIDVQNDIGIIRGIIHGAGLAGGGLIQTKDWEEVLRVFAPKIKGAYYLNKYAEFETLDFMMLFSSIAAFAATPGQVDYSMANIYLDACSDYGMINGKNIITVNWPAWNDVGMAVKHQNINEKYIHSIDSDDAMSTLWNILENKYVHVVVGQWNPRELHEITGINIGPGLQCMIQQMEEVTENVSEKESVPIIMEGRGDENYTEEETIISEIWGNVLGLSTVNIYMNFNDIGGNSIFAVKMMELLNEKYPEMFDITDMFSYSSVYQLAEHIRAVNDSSENDAKEKDILEYVGNNSEELNDGLEGMLEQLSKGEIDVSDLDEWIK